MANERSSNLVIVALCPKCKGWVQMCSDAPEIKREARKLYAAAAEMGLNVERTTVAYCKTLPMCECSGK